MQEGGVTLVSLDHQILALTQSRISTCLIEQTTDDKRGILSRLTKDRGNQTGRSGFAMRACNSDTKSVTHQLCQHLGSRHHRDAILPGRNALRVVLRHRR